MNKPIISVIVPAYNEEAEIRMCLDSLLKQSLNKKYYEVILVDNGSVDSTAKIIKTYPFRYIHEPKRSVVFARQRGVDESLGKIIVSGDADTKYPNDWLLRIYDNFIADPKLIGLVGWIEYRGKNSGLKLVSKLAQEINLSFSNHSRPFPLAFAANFAFKKSALKKIGGYPKHLPELGDQQYLLKKFLKIGKVIVDPKVKCFTSNRQFKDPTKNLFLYNGWHRIVGYTTNSFFKKEVIGAKPTVRRSIARSQKSH